MVEKLLQKKKNQKFLKLSADENWINCSSSYYGFNWHTNTIVSNGFRNCLKGQFMFIILNELTTYLKVTVPYYHYLYFTNAGSIRKYSIMYGATLI